MVHQYNGSTMHPALSGQRSADGTTVTQTCGPVHHDSKTSVFLQLHTRGFTAPPTMLCLTLMLVLTNIRKKSSFYFFIIRIFKYFAKHCRKVFRPVLRFLHVSNAPDIYLHTKTITSLTVSQYF